MKKIFVAVLLIAMGYSCSDSNDDGDDETTLKRNARLKIDYPLIDNVTSGRLKISHNQVNDEVVITLPYTGEVELYPGEHTIVELNAPTGYQRNAKSKRIVNVLANKSDTVKLYNAPTVDETLPLYYENRKPLPGGIPGGDFLIGVDYKAIRIGEYYWMNTNMNHKEPRWDRWATPIGQPNDYPITQATLDKYMEQLKLDKAAFQNVNINDFYKYYGEYYDYFTIDYMNSFATIYEGKDKKETGWEQAYVKDFRQLFAMCPFRSGDDKILHEQDVRFALSAKKGDNPMANYEIDGECGGVYWFDPKYTDNMYGFNMMPGGARMNLVPEGQTSPWYTNPCGETTRFEAVTGDIYHLFYTVKYKAKDGYISLHDFVDTGYDMSYHWYNIRWCRRMSDDELGYKLYVSTTSASIKNSAEWNQLKNGEEIPLLRKVRAGNIKPSDLNVEVIELLSPDNEPEEGWIELPSGYLRGFYVQYFIPDNKGIQYNSDITVQDVIKYASSVDDVSLK